jgi:hypothetical protein
MLTHAAKRACGTGAVLELFGSSASGLAHAGTQFTGFTGTKVQILLVHFGPSDSGLARMQVLNSRLIRALIEP